MNGTSKSKRQGQVYYLRSFISQTKNGYLLLDMKIMDFGPTFLNKTTGTEIVIQKFSFDQKVLMAQVLTHISIKFDCG